MFGYSIVVDQYKSNRASGELKGKEQTAVFAFFLCLFLVIPYVSLEHYLAATLVGRETPEL